MLAKRASLAGVVRRALLGGAPNRRACLSTGAFDELDKFRSAAWSAADSARDPTHALQALNEVRCDYFEKVITSKDSKILDVGCGGGLLLDGLHSRGFTDVVGIDVVEESINAAKKNFPWVDAKVRDVSSMKQNTYDVVACLEVIEHVSDWKSFVKDVCAPCKLGGYVIFSTMQKTILSYLLAIGVAERTLVPPGTHDWDKFVDLDDLEEELLNHNCRFVDVIGFTYFPKIGWKTSKTLTSVNYLVVAEKKK